MGIYHTRVAGVSFRNDDGTSRQEILASMMSAPGILRLADAATAQYPESIAVFNDRNQQLGHLPADVARLVRKRVPDFASLSVGVRSIGYGGGEYEDGAYVGGGGYGCLIYLLDPSLPDSDDATRTGQSQNAFRDALQGFDQQTNRVDADSSADPGPGKGFIVFVLAGLIAAAYLVWEAIRWLIGPFL